MDITRLRGIGVSPGVAMGEVLLPRRVIFTDMFGGTPSNLSFSFLKDNQVEMITGVNLPMLIKFVSLQRNNNLKDVAKKVVDQGKKNIHLVSALLGSRTK